MILNDFLKESLTIQCNECSNKYVVKQAVISLTFTNVGCLLSFILQIHLYQLLHKIVGIFVI
jgi:hypothetical protein